MDYSAPVFSLKSGAFVLCLFVMTSCLAEKKVIKKTNPSPISTPVPKIITNFKIGDVVELTKSANVRNSGLVSPATLIGQQPIGAIGTIKEGPTQTNDSNGIITWWRVDFQSSHDGWLGEDNLKIRTTVSAPSSCSGVASGTTQSRTMYQNAGVPCGTSNLSETQTRTCTNGVFSSWSGTYSSSSCAVQGQAGRNLCVNKTGAVSCFSSIMACVVQAAPGDSCVVSAGTYNEVINPSITASPLNPITVKAATGAEVLVDGINTDNSNFVFVEGLKLKSMTRDKITWHFGSYVTGGTYINGDFWVKGPVNITDIKTVEETFEWTFSRPCTVVGTNVVVPGLEDSIQKTFNCSYVGEWRTGNFTITGTPNCRSDRGGSMLNLDPEQSASQGIESGSGGQFQIPIPYDAALNFALKLPEEISVSASSPINSLVSVCSILGASKMRFSRSAALTVVLNIPESTNFRPYYSGPEKSLDALDFSDINWNLLKSYATPSGYSSHSADSLMDNLKRLIVEKDGGWSGEPNTIFKRFNGLAYGREISYATGDAALFLHSNASQADKAKVLVMLLQYGIDILGAVENGMDWKANGGHNHGRLIPFYFAVRLFELDNNLLSTYADRFQESQQHGYASYNSKLVPEWNSSSPTNVPYDSWTISGYRFINGSPSSTALLAMMLMENGNCRTNVKNRLVSTRAKAWVEYLLDVYFPIETARPKTSIRSEASEIGVGNSTNKIRPYTKGMWDTYLPSLCGESI